MDYNKFLQALGVKKRLIFLSSEVKETYRGYPIRIVFEPSSKTVTLKLSYGGGLSGYISKGEEDQDYLWEVKPPVRNRDLEEKVKEILKELFTLGLQSIEIRPSDLRLEVSVKEIIKNSNYAVFKRICDLAIGFLAILKEHFPAVGGREKFFNYHLIYILPIMAMLIEIFLAIYLSILARQDFNPLTLLSRYLLTLYGFSFVLPYYLWARKVLQGYGLFRRHRHKLIALSLIWLLISTPFWTAINGYLDSSTPYTKEFLIVEKRLSRPGSQASFLVILSDGERKSGQIFELICRLKEKRISLPKQAYEKVVPGKSKVEVELKRGFLGIEWYRSYQLRI